MSSDLKLTRIDDLLRSDHSNLCSSDECYFLHEYVPRGGWDHNDTNNTISNLKKTMDRQGRTEWHYKVKAIRQVIRELTEALKEWHFSEVTIVPVPPSSARGDPNFDDRMIQVAEGVAANIGCDARELLVVQQSRPALHANDGKRSIPDLVANMYVDEDVASPAPTYIAVLDDVLTTGATFVACKSRLLERFPEAEVMGLYFARCQRIEEAIDLDWLVD